MGCRFLNEYYNNASSEQEQDAALERMKKEKEMKKKKEEEDSLTLEQTKEQVSCFRIKKRMEKEQVMVIFYSIEELKANY